MMSKKSKSAICHRRNCRKNKMQIKLQNRNALLFALLVVMLLSSCGSKTDADDFFPLQAGKSWTYRVTTELGEGIAPKIESLTLDTRGEEQVAGVKAMRRHSDSGVDYWLRNDDKGIYRVASKNALDAKPKADEVPRYVLRKPYAVDTTWQASTVAYILQRRNELPKEIRYTHKPVMMIYRIEALNQKVTTTAGNFEGCIKVLGEAKIRLYVDAQFAWRDIPLFSTEWYCPKVGLVRVERVETSPSKFVLGGSMLLDLTNWQ
jgi:hypothetical protein